MYILHIIPKEFLIFFFQAADQKTKGKFILFGGRGHVLWQYQTFFDEDDFFFNWCKNKDSI